MKTENNKIIAEFMGLVYEPYYLPQHKTIEFKYGECVETEHFNTNELKFHSDWNWLMEVVEKIEEIDNARFNVEINQYTCRIYDTENFEDIIDIDCSDSKIKATFDACLGFIKWYNEQNS